MRRTAVIAPQIERGQLGTTLRVVPIVTSLQLVILFQSTIQQTGVLSCALSADETCGNGL